MQPAFVPSTPLSASGPSDWVLKATGHLLHVAQGNEPPALKCVAAIHGHIVQRRASIMERTGATGDAQVLSLISEDLVLGAQAFEQAMRQAGQPEIPALDTDLQARLIYAAARAVTLTEAETLLLTWWDNWQRTATEQSREDPRAADYFIQTSQEVDALLCSICDGPRGTHWRSNPQAGTRIYERKGLAHAVRLELMEEERNAGMTIEALERLTLSQDADAVFAILYVSRLLAPPSPLLPNLLPSVWIDGDDVISKIGWTPRSRVEREEMRRKVWDYLRFGARACVTGRRNGKYFDRTTGQEINTYIEGPAWVFIKRETPVQPSLFPEENVPVRVRLVASEEWAQLTTSPMLAQYLPLGELLGAITPDQPSGAWARVLGLALASFWRRQPRATIDGSIKLTRRELLEHYPPKVAPPLDVLTGKHPRRAIDYWFSALQILVANGFLAPHGETLRNAKVVVENLPRYNWHDPWLSEKVDLLPGPAMRGAIDACANALPIVKRRDLSAPKRRGRPRKNPLQNN